MLPQIPIDDREIASATFHFKIAVVEVCLHPVATKRVIAHTGCSRSTGKKPDEDADFVLRFHQRVDISKFPVCILPVPVAFADRVTGVSIAASVSPPLWLLSR